MQITQAGDKFVYISCLNIDLYAAFALSKDLEKLSRVNHFYHIHRSIRKRGDPVLHTGHYTYSLFNSFWSL